jgi:hypothetical protein
MPFKFRFTEYMRLLALSACFAGIVIPCAVFLVKQQSCNTGFYNLPGSVECIDC